MEGVIPIFTADSLDKELRLSERGDADGERDFPPTSAADISPTEGLVVARVEGAIKQKSNEILGVGSGQDFTSLPQDLETLASEPQTILTQYRARKSRAQSAHSLSLEHAHDDYARAYRDYRAFRIQHGLTEIEPRYDTVFWRKIFFLALLFIVEVAANGWVIGQASPGGLVQGWTTALMISVLVLLTGSLIGFGPARYLNYNGVDGAGRVHRIWAIPTMIVGCVLLLFFAFYIAHYRFALTHADLDTPVPDNILTAMATTPFEPFQQLESLALFIIALLIGTFAIIRGFYWDDPYPGYGARHRKVEEARETTREIAMEMSRDIDAAKDEADKALNAVAEESSAMVGALKQAIARTQDNAATWDFTVSELLTEGRAAMDRYRDANREARSSAPPRYFDTDAFASAAPATSAIMLESLTTSASRATGNITACKSQIAGARGQLEAEYQSFYEDELAPFLKAAADTAHINARTEFDDAHVDKVRPEPDAEIELEEIVPMNMPAKRKARR